MESGSRLGHEVTLIHPGHCLSKIISGVNGFGGGLLSAGIRILIPRIGATINEYALSAVRHFQQAGIRVINGFESILLAKNKFSCLQTLAAFGVPVPDSYLISNVINLKKAIDALGGYPVVVKTPNGRQGAGIMLVRDRAGAEFVATNLPAHSHGLILQRFIPPGRRRDVRAFVIGEKVVGAVELKPPQGDFRANVHVGGKASSLHIDGYLADLAVKATKALGLEISGTDIIIDADGKAAVIEVNYSPGFRGLEACTGIDIASQIVIHATGKEA